jgi:hypothetical protein
LLDFINSIYKHCPLISYAWSLVNYYFSCALVHYGAGPPCLKPVAYALFFFREIFLAKLPDCNLYRLTNNLTPDPLAWDLPYFATMDQGSSLRGVICNYKPTQDDTRKDYR